MMIFELKEIISQSNMKLNVCQIGNVLHQKCFGSAHFTKIDTNDGTFKAILLVIECVA
jgi:hypothetical protein